MYFWPPQPGLTLISRQRSTISGDRLDRLDRRARVDHDARRAAELADQLERVVDVRRRLGMDR